jgi:hypothetical protein
MGWLMLAGDSTDAGLAFSAVCPEDETLLDGLDIASRSTILGGGRATQPPLR